MAVIIENKRNFVKMKEYNYTQSCSFPLNRDKKGGGTEKDGTISNKFCSMCYENGEFLTPPEIDTPQKMQKFCIQEMKKSGINGFLAWIAPQNYSKT
ncbi:MAG: zinc ribbon domain-containing protein [Bacteroidetes bacterium]|nr:zinc ribbon domain-containing protein [Bacteroidota bacterium]